MTILCTQVFFSGTTCSLILQIPPGRPTIQFHADTIHPVKADSTG